MLIEFDTLYREKSLEEIHALIWNTVQSAVFTQYGETPDSKVSERVRQEWCAMEQSETILDVAALYELTLWLKDNDIPYWVRGCAGSSFILYLLGVTCGNPLPPHYHCPKCHLIYWDTKRLDGFDLPQDNVCENDDTQLVSDGHNIPWQTLWGYGENIPVFDIDLPANLYDDFVRALEAHWLNKFKSAADFDRPSDSEKKSRHFFNLCLMFVLDDALIHKSFYSKDIDASCTQLALKAWQTLLDYTKQYDNEMMPPPASFADLISLFGITHSTGTWDEAASAMSANLNYSLSDMIAFRDDIYHYLLSHDFLEKDAWRGMNQVRKGKGLPVITEEMKIARDKWVLNRCERIAYLFPKAHVVEYILFCMKAMVFPESKRGLSTGYAELDRNLVGIDKTDIILIGSRPGVGKSTLAIDIANHISNVENKSVAIFTSADGADLWRKNTNLMVCEENPLNINGIHHVITTNKIDFLVIDYIQVLKELCSKNATSVKTTMRKIKSLAKETNTAFLLLSQLSRKADRRKNHLPLLEDIPWHDCIDPYVDRIYLLYREAYYDANADKSEAWCFAMKNIRGCLGEVPLHINWERAVFPRNSELDYKFVSELIHSLPQSDYSSVYITTTSAKIDDLIFDLCNRCVVIEADISELIDNNLYADDCSIVHGCDCLVIKGFEKIESIQDAQENLITLINKSLTEKTKIIIISQKECWKMNIDGRLRSRISWGIQCEL